MGCDRRDGGLGLQLSQRDYEVWQEDCAIATAYNTLCRSITDGGGGNGGSPISRDAIDTASFRNTVQSRIEVVVPSTELQVQEDAHQFLVMLWVRSPNR